MFSIALTFVGLRIELKALHGGQALSKVRFCCVAPAGCLECSVLLPLLLECINTCFSATSCDQKGRNHALSTVSNV